MAKIAKEKMVSWFKRSLLADLISLMMAPVA